MRHELRAFFMKPYYTELVQDLLGLKNCIKATKYVCVDHVLKATRKTYGGKIGNGRTVDIVLTIGKPNYPERQFIKACLKAGEKFPIRKIQYKFLKSTPKYIMNAS